MTEEIEVRDALTDPDPRWHPWYGEEHCYCGEPWCGDRTSSVTRLVNITPHPVTIAGVTIEPTAPPARVAEGVDECSALSTPDGHLIPVADIYPQRVVDLPPPREDTIYIVSRAVAAACPDRDDLMVPDGRARDRDGSQTGGAARLGRVQGDIRLTLAELAALDAALPHEPNAEWPTHLAERRRTLVLRLWHLARWAGWTVGYDRDPSDPHRPHISVVCLPTGGQVRSYIDVGTDGGPAVHLPWDGSTRADKARAIAEYLAATAS